MQAFGGINSASSALGEFGKNLETTLGNFDSSIGKWNDTITPMIESLGSIKAEDITAAAVELVETANADLEKVSTSNVDSETTMTETTPENESVQASATVDNSEKFETIQFEVNRFGFGI